MLRPLGSLRLFRCPGVRGRIALQVWSLNRLFSSNPTVFSTWVIGANFHEVTAKIKKILKFEISCKNEIYCNNALNPSDQWNRILIETMA